MKKKYNGIISKVFLVVVLISILLIYIFFRPVNTVVNITIVSFIISYAIKPIRNFMCEKFKITKRKSALIIVLSFILLIGILIYFIVPSILKESENFGAMLDNVEGYYYNLVSKLNLENTAIFETLYIQINEKANIMLESFSNNLIDNLIGFMENALGFAVIPVVVYYLLSDGDKIYNKLLLIFPTEKRVMVKKVVNNIDKVLSRYIISQLILSLIIGILTFIVTVALKIKFPLVLSILNGLVNIIPYFGPVIGGVPIVILALIQSPTKALLAIVAVMVIQQIEGDLLAPKITGESTDLHPIIIIILLILGEKAGGLAGMILAVPIVVTIKVIYNDIDYYLF